MQKSGKLSRGMAHMNRASRVNYNGGSVVDRRTPEREVGGSKPTSAVLCCVLAQDT